MPAQTRETNWLGVSVIIPAYNAEDTISDALSSLLAQSSPHWEAIVVDDGSGDETSAVVGRMAEQDPRIRLFTRDHAGVSAARNFGVSQARFDWLLFLDADDWVLPQYIERMTDMLLANPALDGVHCGWVCVALDGTREADEFWNPTGNIFADMVSRCPFAIHACLVRRSLVNEAGGFDASLRTCEDWDLWLRIARAGGRFGAVREALAYYRMRPRSASTDAHQIFADGLRVITAGHAPDTRVSNPAATSADGLSVDRLPGAKLMWVCWPAGLLIGQGQDARILLTAIKDASDPDLQSDAIAWFIFKATLLPHARKTEDWIDLWPVVEARVFDFLEALEAQSKIRGLNRLVRTALARLILQHSRITRPTIVGSFYGVRVEVFETISDITVPEPAERIHCSVEIEKKRLGFVELPVCDGVVPRHVLVDAIAAEFAWPIIGRFFAQTIYPRITIKREQTKWTAWREGIHLASGPVEDEPSSFQQLHDRVGWTIFLQEIWGRPDWTKDQLYDPRTKDKSKERRSVEGDRLSIEVSADIPDHKISGRTLDVSLTVGGAFLGTFTVARRRRKVRAQELKSELTTAAGFELCRAAVREALLGKSLTDQPTALRARLAAAALTRRDEMSAKLLSPDGLPSGDEFIARGGAATPECGLVFGRRNGMPVGTSVSRQAALPAAAAPELISAARILGEPFIHVPSIGAAPLKRVSYAPDLILSLAPDAMLQVREASGPETLRPNSGSMFNRSYFESIFAGQPDPWRYTNSYEQTKYEQTISLIPPVRIGRALELACAEGHFTRNLAGVVENLTAADISQIALNRAAERCADLGNVRFVKLDLANDPFPGQFELIVCSEVLYYLKDWEELRAVGRKFAAALVPGGWLITAHANLVVDEPGETGFGWDHQFGAKAIGETLAKTKHLRLVKELRTALYRIQLFRRESPRLLRFRHSSRPEIVHLPQPKSLPPEIAAQILWRGGTARRHETPSEVFTSRLPILMYHRVAPTGSNILSRYRVAPHMFEEQLAYLKDAGYYTVSLEEWRVAKESRRPLPGRAILITFDDGYRDFLIHAWPLLKKYDFSATVFLVAEMVGRQSTWDAVYEDCQPLLGWDEVRLLQNEGVEFGSHSASHRPLTTLDFTGVVREAIRSRVILTREIGVPVRSFAYPYGETDSAVQHLIGACGYTTGLSCRTALSTFNDPLLNLPRIEISGSDSLEHFIAKLKP